MSSGNVIVSEKLKFPISGSGFGNHAANGNEMMVHQNQAHRLQFFHVDERDGFISWLRGEFAAANAMIDALCHHLRCVGDPGEYESVIGIIHQRRCNWNQVLHMQQYFSVADVSFGLQQVAMRKMQHNFNPRFGYDQSKMGKSSSSYSYKGNRGGDSVKEIVYSSRPDCVYLEKSDEVISVENSEKPSKNVGTQSEDMKVSSNTNEETKSTLIDNSFENDNEISPQIFDAPELIDGHQVNVVQGLKLYDHLLSNTEVSNLVSLVNELRFAGRNGQFLGQTYVVARRPTRGHGREIIQFGIPVVDSPPDDEERKVESIPALLQDVIDRMITKNLTTLKPDCCIIDIYNEGDHSQPYLWPPSYGKSISTLTLTDCDIIFGRAIVSDHPGDYKGPLKLSLGPGSLLVMEGKSSEFARHALPSIPKQRLLVTFIKTQLKKFSSLESGHRNSSSQLIPPTRSLNHARHSTRSGNHFSATVPPLRSPISSPNVMQPLFVAAQISFPPQVAVSPVSSGWSGINPRHPGVHVPGTGVFLPPSGSASGCGSSDGSGSTEAERLMNGEDSSSKHQGDDRIENLVCNGEEEVNEEKTKKH